MQVETDSMILFWHSDSIFSNWYQPVKIEYNNQIFENTEALFMFMKAKFFNDEEIALEIVNNQDPKSTKALGRNIKNYDDVRWGEVRYSFMRDANFLKFSQNKNLGYKLIETGNKILAEASPYDTVWGIGLYPNSPAAKNESTWKGQNLLGKCLMEVRENLKE